MQNRREFLVKILGEHYYCKREISRALLTLSCLYTIDIKKFAKIEINFKTSFFY